jgi:hypothetical protein
MQESLATPTRQRCCAKTTARLEKTRVKTASSHALCGAAWDARQVRESIVFRLLTDDYLHLVEYQVTSAPERDESSTSYLVLKSRCLAS